MKSSNVSPIFYVVLVISLGFLGVVIFKVKPFNQNSTTPTSTETSLGDDLAVVVNQTPAPTSKPSPRPIPSGKTEFMVSQSDKTKPQLSKGSLDPYDPAQGKNQTITIIASDEQPVTQVTAVLKTDNSISEPLDLKLIEGVPESGTWQGSWTITDTYLYTYNLVLTAVSSRGQGSVEITLR